MDLLTLGETMGLYAATGTGPLDVGTGSRFSFAGAETNVAIGMARLGHSCAFVGRLGDDAAGRAVLRGLRAESVDVAAVTLDADASTGLLVRELRTADRARVSYHRRSSAGSRLGPGDVEPDTLRSARLLHVTGITPALSRSCAEAVRHAVRTAKDAEVTVSFDVNHRSRLWPAGEAACELGYLLEAADIVFAGLEEAQLFLDDSPDGRPPGDPEATARALGERAMGEVVLKLGAGGALALAGGQVHHQAGIPVTAVDAVGAGDAFVAGYLSAYLSGADVPGRLERGCLCGAFAVSCHGDWEGAPTLAELPLLAGDDVLR